MVKGFIIYKNGKIPFVIDKYRMELFTDDKILNDFMQEHNKKRNYILSGVYFSLGTEPRKITILVEHSLGSTCYLSCYIVENLHVKEGYNEIGIQSSYLDDVFRYKYNYIDLSRTGINFAVDIKEVYSIPFEMGDNTYNLKYCIGHNGNLGLINDVIYQNSYVKCVGKTEDELERVKNVHFETFSPTKCIMKYSDGSIQDRIIKREVFFYEEDKDMNAHSFDYMSTYKTSIEGKIGRNDKCVCGSGKKYKKCCISKYEKAARILQDIYNQKNVDYTIPGARVVEDSILEYEGPQEKLKNKHDKDIIEKIIELSEKEEIRKKP